MKPRTIKLTLLAVIILSLWIILNIGCTTAGKATRYFDGHRDTAAGYCATRYPIRTDCTYSVITPDSTIFKQYIDGNQRYIDSLLKVAGNRDAMLETAKVQIKEWQEKGEYSESVAQQLASMLNNIPQVDTAALRLSIAAQIRATLKPCHDTTITKVVENTAHVAAAEARAAKVQAAADEYTAGRDKPDVVFGWLMRALARKWWFWLIVVGVLVLIVLDIRRMIMPKL